MTETHRRAFDVPAFDVPAFDVPTFDIPAFDVVVPTVARPQLACLLQALADSPGPLPGRIVLVDDRPDGARAGTLLAGLPPRWRERALVLRSGGRGPAAARNTGWLACTAEWIAFLDDDVVVQPAWLERLAHDLELAGPDTGGVEARIVVPRPAGRAPTDWERNVGGLERARFATADMVYRRIALAAVGGFDERFPAAYREDADLATRVRAAGWRIERGTRSVLHPVRDADAWISVRLQRGNRDDALLRRRYGPDWRSRVGTGAGGFRGHALTTAAWGGALLGAAAGRRRLALGATAVALGRTAAFAWSRIAPGPRTRDEMRAMALTSVLIPPVAVWHRIAGEVAVRRAARAGVSPRAVCGTGRPARAVLFDRDGTLVEDVPYNGDPALVQPVPGAADALECCRDAGVVTALVSNQSGVARGLLTEAEVRAVNERLEALVGPLGPHFVCLHGEDEGCACRKPRPGLVLAAAERLGVEARDCVMIGDTEADVHAALAAGARAILVPNDATRPEEVLAAPEVAPTLRDAVRLALGRPGEHGRDGGSAAGRRAASAVHEEAVPA